MHRAGGGALTSIDSNIFLACSKTLFAEYFLLFFT